MFSSNPAGQDSTQKIPDEIYVMEYLRVNQRVLAQYLVDNPAMLTNALKANPSTRSITQRRADGAIVACTMIHIPADQNYLIKDHVELVKTTDPVIQNLLDQQYNRDSAPCWRKFLQTGIVTREVYDHLDEKREEKQHKQAAKAPYSSALSPTRSPLQSPARSEPSLSVIEISSSECGDQSDERTDYDEDGGPTVRSGTLHPQSSSDESDGYVEDDDDDDEEEARAPSCNSRSMKSSTSSTAYTHADTTRPYPAPATETAASRCELPSGRKWRLFEQECAIKHMLDVRDEGVIKGENRFAEVSRRLTDGEKIKRTRTAVKNFWNRIGRARSGFDERKNRKAPLSTSHQARKASGGKTLPALQTQSQTTTELKEQKGKRKAVSQRKGVDKGKGRASENEQKRKRDVLDTESEDDELDNKKGAMARKPYILDDEGGDYFIAVEGDEEDEEDEDDMQSDHGGLQTGVSERVREQSPDPEFLRAVHAAANGLRVRKRARTD